MTPPNDAARPFMLVRKSQSDDLFEYFESREQASQFRCLDYPDDLIEGYADADYDALRAEVERLHLRDLQLSDAVALLSARAKAAEAKVARVSALYDEWRKGHEDAPKQGSWEDGYDAGQVCCADELRAALNEGGV